ncbi:SDR family NAD(P)-dependent oxidoreductase [Glaciibacter psychrotolerans]|uniref:NAD(P)-dependent dehydrogenase (Short-subunit alcohol dehydrogenase family) n=1 Tax=Glaciibacter psychrotolerans TaxID=670054 RepID=A0A7Z0EGE8_9MICO|nr:SDR family NAD(P)-dependent oxidoreductase [Leifsonia psychrotolerans]NYJ20474.1 NAD(P)-dependent dehydrogenase (short-subunit alcohol dehydrogenase family) [Leifsonia psychrotolerans]
MTNNDVPQATAIVTGGAAGIGGGVSRRLAADGFHVLLVDNDEAEALATRTDIERAGGQCTVVVADVTSDAGVAALGAALDIITGTIDILVNNVGDFRPAKAVFHKSTPEQWEALHRINLWHVLTVSHLVVPRMIAQGSGSIVNVSTVEAFRGIPGNAVYSAYKAGVSAFTKSLAVELAPSGIRVNAIAPDLTDTAQTSAEAMLEGRDPDAVRTWVPLGRFGTPEDHSGVVAFLASDDARYVTGHTIPVDGGTLAASGWYLKSEGRGWTNRPNAV